MGNCVPKDGDSSTDSVPTGSLNTNMLRELVGNVEKKYEIVKTIGEGSMGAISKARVREGKIGGSAYKDEQGDKGIMSKVFKVGEEKNMIPLGDRRENEVFYALKTIQLARISESFIEELRNEIDILKSMDHPK